MNNEHPPITHAPLISVVIPTYKRPDLLARALESVLVQDFTDFEVIVVDDNGKGSPVQRETEDMLEGDFPDERIRYVVHEQGLGGGGARNTGIDEARGEYIAFLDDDDQWLPGKLARQVEYFRSLPEHVCSVDTGFYEINEEKGTVREFLPALRGRIFEELLVKHKGRAPKLSSVLCRAEAIREVRGFDTTLPSRQDLDLYLRLARRYSFEHIAEPLVNKYVHTAGRISGSSAGKIRGFELFYRKYHEDLVQRPELHRIYLSAHARWLRKGRKYLRAAWKYAKSLFV